MKILLIHNEPHSRHLLRHIVSRQKWDCVTVSDVEDIKNVRHVESFDCAISDIIFPGKSDMDYLSFYFRHDILKTIPLYVVTGVAKASLIKNPYMDRLHGFQNKPFSAVELVSRLNQLSKVQPGDSSEVIGAIMSMMAPKTSEVTSDSSSPQKVQVV